MQSKILQVSVPIFVVLASIVLALPLKSLPEWTEEANRDRRIASLQAVYRGLEEDDKKNYGAAIEAFQEAIRLAPDIPKNYDFLGRTYYKMGLWEKAIDAHMQSIRINPTDADAYYSIGGTYVASGRLREASNAFKEAIRIDPNNAEFHAALGVCYADLGYLQEGLDAWAQALEIDPNNALANASVGKVFAAGAGPEARKFALEKYKLLKDLGKDHLANEVFDAIYK